MSKTKEFFLIILCALLVLSAHLLMHYALNVIADKITNPPHRIIKIY